MAGTTRLELATSAVTETALGFTGTYKLRRPPKSLQNVPNFESCGSAVDQHFPTFLPAKEVERLVRLDSQARPFPDFRDAHTTIRLPSY